MKYRILIDHGFEGWSFWDKQGYRTLDKAVKVAQANTYGNKFLIIKVIDWQASPKKT